MDAAAAERHLLGLELFGMRFGLDRMHKLLSVLGLPQRRFASIHVVGTNGKSSTTRMIAAILERHGLRTGSYTSPHLRSFAERIEVGERPLSGDELAAAVERVAQAAAVVERTLEPGDRVTQFEVLTAAAYDELARRGVEVAVVEAGLGGRYDATNVLPSKVQVLTSVGLEHTRWLGSTVGEIAAEKLAVVRDHATLVTGLLPPEAEAEARGVAGERHARLVRAPARDDAARCLAGGFQRRNFAVARAAAEAFVGPLDPEAVERVAQELEIPGRLQVVDESPLTVLDGAHNPSGAAALAEALPELTGDRPLVLVLGILDDKDAAAVMRELVPLADGLVVTRAPSGRALDPDALARIAADLDGPAPATISDPRAALEYARAQAAPDGAVVATGSIYLVADLMAAPAARL